MVSVVPWRWKVGDGVETYCGDRKDNSCSGWDVAPRRGILILKG